MSHNWDTAGQEGFLIDPLFMDFELFSNDAQCPSIGSTSQAPHEPGNNHGNQVNVDLAAWTWTGDSNPPPNQAEPTSTQSAIETTQHQHRKINSELVKKAHDLERQLENRFAQFEKKVNALQNRLEGEAERLCGEIDAHVQKLRGWATEVEALVEQAAELRDAYQDLHK